MFYINFSFNLYNYPIIFLMFHLQGLVLQLKNFQYETQQIFTLI